MRDIATVNAICWMIRNRQQIADIPRHCGGEAELKASIRRACVDGQVAYDEATEQMMSLSQIDQHVPDWDALVQIARVICLAEG